MADLFVKICGVTTVDDASATVESGASAIGFNFWPRSKRFLAPDARRVVASSVKGRAERWGVFVDPTVAEVEAAFADDLIDVAQLHGDEPPEVAERFAGRVVKALRLAGDHSLDDLDRYAGDRFLVDAPFAGYGGSGLLVDTQLARRAVERAASSGNRVVLAGGLTPENVAELVRAVRPFGVDVASGVESRPGRKEEGRVRAFVRAARDAARDLP